MAERLDYVNIDGAEIGFQLNKKSMGRRGIHCRVHAKDGFPWCYYQGLMVSVLPTYPGSTHHFTAHHVIGEAHKEGQRR